MNPISWITSNVEKAVLGGAAILFLVSTLWLAILVWQAKGDLKRVTGERNVAQQELGRCEAVNDQWEGAHKDWQVAVDSLKAVKERKDGELREARKASASRVRSLQSAASAIRAHQPAGANMCARVTSVDDAFVAQLRGIK